LCAFGKTSQSIPHPKITPDQAYLTPEFFTVGVLKKKVYIDDMGILSILLSLET
jgi:hypothetical protein